jgi:hypothetical protein
VSFDIARGLPWTYSCSVPSPETEQQLALNGDIARLVSDASADHVVLRVSEEARRLARSYSSSGLSTDEIAKFIVRLATTANVAVELDGKG